MLSQWIARRRLKRKRKTISFARQAVFNHVSAIHGTTVAYGAFKGLNIGEHSWWAGADRTAKILGTYESHVVNRIANYDLPADAPFIDLGASDGYFAVGVLVAGLFDRTIAFEVSEDGRAALATTAKTNGVTDRIDIRGLADDETLAALSSANASGVVLVDIEGAEFDVLNGPTLARLKNFHIIVELHDMFMENGAELRSELLARAAPFFDHEVIRPSPTPMHDFRELDHFNDDSRCLAFSESRGGAMEWLILKPRALNP